MATKKEKEKNVPAQTPVIDKKKNTALSEEELAQISGGRGRQHHGKISPVQ